MCVISNATKAESHTNIVKKNHEDPAATATSSRGTYVVKKYEWRTACDTDDNVSNPGDEEGKSLVTFLPEFKSLGRF